MQGYMQGPCCKWVLNDEQELLVVGCSLSKQCMKMIYGYQPQYLFACVFLTFFSLLESFLMALM